ncbi:C-GCAxxG-C-C family protein [Draconibacterium sp. IB214405]|uniref:C-GCAxxG-C-C family protein n=1 Tax=Draconibacterium sp. IB214405 TaxID=3097352 RepID=UPI002A11A723|nr:C-GCAxxG-C-C family protein [Draconibacterium sp. IB214405]MDX8340944.1 C-GCAxxG-C-C family protein [Draconibacterium sp. IB214405]
MKKLFDDNMIADKATELFWQDYNCAQSVLAAYTDVLQVDKETVFAVSRGFGGGMGRLQGTCGAVTGAYMVFGLADDSAGDNPEKVATAYDRVQKFHKQFTADKGSTVCKELINCDLNTEKGQNFFKENQLKKNICEGCIRDAVKMINAILAENTNA